MKRFIFRAAFKSLGIALFILILFKINWNKLYGALVANTAGNLPYFIFTLILLFPLIYIKVLRWRLIQRDLGINISQKEGTRYYLIGLFAGAATPGQLGEFIKTIYLRKKGYQGGAAFFGVLYDRIYDIIALGFVFFLGLAFLSGKEKSEPLLYAIGIFIIVFFALFLLWRGFRRFITIDIFKHILPYGIKRRLKEYNIDADVHRYQMRRSSLFFSLLLTLVAYVVVFYRYYLLLLTMNLHPPFSVWFSGVALATFITLIPVSVSGIGTRDAVLIGIFKTAGISAEKAVGFSLLILSLMAFNGLIGLIVWMKNPIIPKKTLEI